MDVVIEVSFIAVNFDDFDKKSGKSYSDRIVFSVDELQTVVEIQDKIFDYVGGLQNSHTGHVKVIDVKMINLAG